MAAATQLPLQLPLVGAQVVSVLWFMWVAYEIRMYPIKDFGHVIHEFDPWFNYRATEYLAEHGLSKFLTWYDYMSWYPLGRPIGTTIYPGMQVTAVAIWEAMKRVPQFSLSVPAWLTQLRPLRDSFSQSVLFLPPVPEVLSYEPLSLNDICCLIPPWFGAVASLFTGLLTFEISRSANAAVIAVGIMAVIPAHLMRSVGGEFDNEAVAVAAICSTFWLWLRSVRTPRSWPLGLLTGVSYGYMVAAWGGYIFVLNMIGVHAAALVALGRFNSGVHKAYSLFFAVGTMLAMQIPVVGLSPVRSLEQMGPLLVFLGYQVLAFCDMRRIRTGMDTKSFVLYRVQTVAISLALLVGVACALYPTGYFGPLSSRIRALFVPHTQTGNPLVDSVAEHMPADDEMYQAYIGAPLDYVLLGGAVSLLNRNNGFYFLLLYAMVAAHFSGKMSRLLLICGPVCSVACAIWFGFVLDFLLEPLVLLLGKPGFRRPSEARSAPSVMPASSSEQGRGGAAGSGKEKKQRGKEALAKNPSGSAPPATQPELAEWEEELRPGGMAELLRSVEEQCYASVPLQAQRRYWETREWLDSDLVALTGRGGFSLFIIMFVLFSGLVGLKVGSFVNECDAIARELSNPTVVFQTRLRNGTVVIVDDYLRGYEWMDANLPKDARVMAWWDYGYQITGIAKRTSIADGNTWNHEHIATLGRLLTSPEKLSWSAIRHLADYVLVWAGGHGDDLGKSPHLARIGNSVFPDHCGDEDPRCTKFGFYSDGLPTSMMKKSLLYKLVRHNISGVYANKSLFKEVHRTKWGLMRVFEVRNVSQESKKWVADPANRICDAPGSWYCVGQYPPALDKLIASRHNFAQLEDFNNRGRRKKSAYTKLVEKEQSGSKASEL